jgi:isopentenyl phosphate kinase
MIPNYEQAIYEHKRGAAQVTADLQRLLSSVEEATLHFDMELQAVQPEGNAEANEDGEYGDEYEDEFKPLTVKSFLRT